MRIRLPYATEEEFIAKYGPHVARGGLFLATRAPKPEGTGLAFELVLAEGGRLLRGEGVVVKAVTEGARAGMTVRFTRLDAHSKALIDRILELRAPAPAPPAPAPVAEVAPPPEPPRRARPVITAEALRKQAERVPIPGGGAPKPAPPPAPEPPPPPTPQPPPPEPPPPAPAPAPVTEPLEPRGRRRSILDVPVTPTVVAAPRDVVLGIDLGSTWTRAAVHHQGSLRRIPVGPGDTLSSLLAVDEAGEVLVGERAREAAELRPAQAVLEWQRLLGRRTRSLPSRAPTAPPPLPREGPEGEARLAARLLRELRTAATTFLGHDVARAVLCVPAHFDDRQRAALREAAGLAGLEVLRILNASSAAALAFGHERGLARKRLLVVDIGGGGLDVSVVQLTGDDLEVISTGSEPGLGGQDFDARLAEALASALQEQGLPRPQTPAEWVPLRLAAESAKLALSERDEVTLPLPGGAAPLVLRRERLEALTADLVQRVTLGVRQVLESSALTPQGLDAVLLLGGQGRMPLVRRRLEESLGVPVRLEPDTSHWAALGAALLGQGLLDAATGKPGATVSDVLSVPLGVAERGGTLRRVLERNTRLPAEKTLVIPVTPGPLSLALFQGPSALALDNEYLGALTFEIDRPGEAEVHLSLSQDGTLSLAATLPSARRHAVTLATALPEEADLEALLARSPLEGDAGAKPGGLFKGLKKLFGRR
ncbi:Hsp70 family protein [Archangium primigenium]|uniref:Hsp70 family protein n=1 Tax=[Archangium] primigenium TaxID=2792470 RepID=UPI00195C7D6A|nr:Hsp70 family protein [Archangium primigenium]MBM7114103.1 TIGR02266 family protein [Archangium primigenium]